MSGRAPMSRHRPVHQPLHQRGFALMSAIFLLVVLGLLGTVMVRMSTTQHIGQTRELLGTRAQLAARAGVEWGVYQVTQGGGSCAASTTLPALGGTAAAFTVTVACSSYGPYDEGGRTVNMYQISATASTGAAGTHAFAERQLTAVISGP
jgi:MSHA biogenesis protein MshP